MCEYSRVCALITHRARPEQGIQACRPGTLTTDPSPRLYVRFNMEVYVCCVQQLMLAQPRLC